MELRSRIPVYARRAALLGALGALLAPATAGAATAHASKAKKRYPVITSVRPMETNIGKTLTIKGKNFKRGRNKNTVLFKRDGARAVFVKADVGTAKLLKVKLPSKLASVLKQVNGSASMTTFRLRVLSGRLGRAFTTLKRSPKIGPALPPAPPKIDDQSVTNPDGDCDGDGQKNGIDADDDNDLLSDAEEMGLKLDPCKSDTDGDGVEDGYELRSAQDWNDDEYQAANGYLPYPSKRPYPNPLDGADGKVDHDGDTLTLKEEYDLWKFTIGRGAPRDLGQLSYSAGEQYSIYTRDAGGKRRPALAAAGYDKQADFLAWADGAGYRTVEVAAVGADWFASRTGYDIRDADRSGNVEPTPNGTAYAAETTYYDQNNDTRLSDEERDEDADGLTNFDETRGCMSSQDYWTNLYGKESPYYLSYTGTLLDNADTDGDGVRDGADDSDHDDLPNLMECSRSLATDLELDPLNLPEPPPGRPVSLPNGFVQPYNPCLPSYTSRSCNSHPTIGAGWAPWGGSSDKYYYVWN
jgi:hypothetical protein